MKSKKNYNKPTAFSGVITNIEQEGPFESKYNNNIQKMSNYYLYKVSIDSDPDKTFNHNLPAEQDFPFGVGERVSFKAFPKKEENAYNIVHKSLAKQLSPEEIQQFLADKEKSNTPEPDKSHQNKSSNGYKMR